MQLSILNVNNDVLRKLSFDAILYPHCLDNTGNRKPVFKPVNEHVLKDASARFEYWQSIQSGEIVIDLSNIRDLFQLKIHSLALLVKNVIHEEIPPYTDGKHGEPELLKSCYLDALNKAKDLECNNILIPLIISPIYGCPYEKALQLATDVISSWLMINEMDVILFVFDRRLFTPSKQLIGKLENFISNNYEFICNPRYKGFWGKMKSNADRAAYERFDWYSPREYVRPIVYYSDPSSQRDLSEREFDSHLEKSFSSTLLKYINLKGMENTAVYKKANIDRKLFSKIQCNKEYMPSKRTAVALAIALELSLEETKDLLNRAGFTLSHSLLFDVIIEYFITNNNYDVYQINIILFKYNLPILGG